MSASSNPVRSLPADELHSKFLALMPRIERHARIYFRHLPCPGKRDDALQECLALAWQWLLRLSQRGKDVSDFPMAFVFLVARAVRCGRKLTGLEKAKDVFSPVAQQRHGFTLESLPSSTCAGHEHLYGDVAGQRRHDAFEERLQDNTVTPVPEQAAFRIDFPRWLQALSERDEYIIGDLLLGARTQDVARKHGLSPGRVSQLRRHYHDSWSAFTDETV
jgi:hypothetical protein